MYRYFDTSTFEKHTEAQIVKTLPPDNNESTSGPTVETWPPSCLSVRAAQVTLPERSQDRQTNPPESQFQGFTAGPEPPREGASLRRP